MIEIKRGISPPNWEAVLPSFPLPIAYDRIAEYCDGWLPIGARTGVDIGAMRTACEKRGRNPDEITLAMFGVPGKEEVIQKYLNEGYTEFLFPLPSDTQDKVIPLLDKYAVLAEKMR